jgi:hypothetical protein
LPFDIENTNFYRTTSPTPDYYFIQNTLVSELTRQV